MFYAGSSALEVIAQILIANLYIGTGIINAVWRRKAIIPRMGQTVPYPKFCLYAGFVMQFAGGIMVLIDWYAAYGAMVLIFFTILAMIIFHRFWEMPDPYKYDTHRQFLFNNGAVIGSLLLIIVLNT